MSDTFTDVNDPILKEQLQGWVDVLISGKPPKLVEMLMNGAKIPDALKARVYCSAGISDGEGFSSSSSSKTPASIEADKRSNNSSDTGKERASKKEKKSSKKKLKPSSNVQ